jgi:hypothetical protein
VDHARHHILQGEAVRGGALVHLATTIKRTNLYRMDNRSISIVLVVEGQRLAWVAGKSSRRGGTKPGNGPVDPGHAIVTVFGLFWAVGQ